jgi:hypothetical protein
MSPPFLTLLVDGGEWSAAHLSHCAKVCKLLKKEPSVAVNGNDAIIICTVSLTKVTDMSHLL